MGLPPTAQPATCPPSILDLVGRFTEHRAAYQQQSYNETQVRREFIDPFFTALGWDIDNRAGHAEAYKDVIHEDAIKVGGATKAPDYCFRIGGTRKFFVEAKKPSVGVADDPGPAYQVRRYAWSNKLPLSIVTDFEEFAVYDCRIPPKPTDKASVARVLYCTFDQYADKWTDIAAIFSKDAILKGSFDKYAESNRRKRGTAEVDEEFLKEISAWRESLAKNFALRNESLSVRDLNFAVERTIDRIIFLRMCEDRSIEPYGRLQALLSGPAVYGRLAQFFREADDKYNAGLFYFRQESDRGPPDELTLSLELDDKVLKEIIARLYYPESPYEFSVLPPEILGHVYEQFLGKVIRLTGKPGGMGVPARRPGGMGVPARQLGGMGVLARRRAVIEEKPEVRKAGGVYYTPTYIVDYIVKHTVGKLLGPIPNSGSAGVSPAIAGSAGVSPADSSDLPPLPGGEGRGEGSFPSQCQAEGQGGVPPAFLTPAEVGPDRETKTGKAKRLPKAAKMLRILDPACGSGSFLLGAYQHLLDWHRDFYVSQRVAPAHNLVGPANSRCEGVEPAAEADPSRERKRPESEQNRDRKRAEFSDRIYQGPGGQWRLTIREKKRILLNNIYGVDIDPQAVEVTKLSLLLKVLEGETAETIGSTLRLFHERALPDLSNNVKCGNSLIGPDFYEGKQLDMFDEEERYRINVFDWRAEFPEVFPDPNRDRKRADSEQPRDRKRAEQNRAREKAAFTSGSSAEEPLSDGRGSDQESAGGFDAVIGNPPWGAEIQDAQRAYLTREYPNVADLESAQYFLSRSIRLLREHGHTGLIVPNTFVLNVYAKRFRDFILECARLNGMVDLSEIDVFFGPAVRSMIILFDRSSETCRVYRWTQISLAPILVRDVTQPQLKAAETWKTLLEKESPLRSLIQRTTAHWVTLSDYCDVRQGYIPYRTTTLTRRFGAAKAKEIVEQRLWHSTKRQSKEYKKELQGVDVGRYTLNWSGVWVRYGEWVSTYLPLSIFSVPRLLVREITSKPPYALLANYTEDLYVHNPSVLAVLPRANTVSPKFVLGILNSRLMSVIFLHVAPKAQKGLFPKVIITDARRLPMPAFERSKASDLDKHDRIVALVDQMLTLHKSLASAKTDHEKTALQRQINATDRQIDQLVYHLYGLTDDEIKIVEEATR